MLDLRNSLNSLSVWSNTACKNLVLTSKKINPLSARSLDAIEKSLKLFRSLENKMHTSQHWIN